MQEVTKSPKKRPWKSPLLKLPGWGKKNKKSKAATTTEVTSVQKPTLEATPTEDDILNYAKAKYPQLKWFIDFLNENPQYKPSIQCLMKHIHDQEDECMERALVNVLGRYKEKQTNKQRGWFSTAKDDLTIKFVLDALKYGYEKAPDSVKELSLTAVKEGKQAIGVLTKAIISTETITFLDEVHKEYKRPKS